MKKEPIYRITNEFLKWSSRARELKAWIEQSVVDVAWLPSLQTEVLTQIAHSSTAIEGNELNLTEVNSLEHGETIQAPIRDKQEVLNYFEAMRWIWKRKKQTAISEKELLYCHKLITKKTLPLEQSGKYKKKPNRIIDHKKITIYTPPSPKEAKPLTKNLLSWINQNKDLDPILISAIAHHQLVSIHPFSDGNGRISRTLGTWLLYTREFDSHHLFALDEYFEQDRKLYYLKIQQARDLDNDLTYWLEYVAKGITKTLEQTKKRIESLQIASKKGKKINLTKRQEDLLRFLRDKGRVKSPDIEKAFQISRARVNQIIKPLVAAGLINRKGQTRATTYHLK